MGEAGAPFWPSVYYPVVNTVSLSGIGVVDSPVSYLNQATGIDQGDNRTAGVSCALLVYVCQLMLLPISWLSENGGGGGPAYRRHSIAIPQYPRQSHMQNVHPLSTFGCSAQNVVATDQTRFPLNCCPGQESVAGRAYKSMAHGTHMRVNRRSCAHICSPPKQLLLSSILRHVRRPSPFSATTANMPHSLFFEALPYDVLYLTELLEPQKSQMELTYSPAMMRQMPKVRVPLGRHYIQYVRAKRFASIPQR